MFYEDVVDVMMKVIRYKDISWSSSTSRAFVGCCGKNVVLDVIKCVYCKFILCFYFDCFLRFIFYERDRDKIMVKCVVVFVAI